MDLVRNDVETVRADQVQTGPNAQVHTERVQTVEKVDPAEFNLYKIDQVVWYLISLICLIVGIRFVLLMLGANRVDFADFIYSVSTVFTAPFAGLFESPTYQDKFFDSASVVALIVYPILGYIVTYLLRLFSKHS